VDVDAALARLGLDRTADVAQVKRSYRRLAHDHHPDRGGDSAAFAELSLAYRVLLEEHRPRPAPPRVATGRPSRPPSPSPAVIDPDDELSRPEPLADAELAALRSGGVSTSVFRPALDAVLLSRLLVTTRGGSMHPLRPLLLLSRAPTARLNALAPLLASSASSSLRIGDPRDTVGAGMRPTDHTRSGVALVLTARGRAARRAVEALDAGLSRSTTSWRRERGDTSVRLQAQVRIDEDPTRTVSTLVIAVEEMLAALAWPLPAWSLDPACLRD
jgi:hypothetical protein